MNDDDLVLLEELGHAVAEVSRLLELANTQGWEIPTEHVESHRRLVAWVAARP